MKTPRRRIQKARRRAEKRAADAHNGARTSTNAPDTVSLGSLVSRGDGTNAVVLADAANAREVVGVVIDVTSPLCLVADPLTPFRRGIVERLRGAGTIVVEVPYRELNATVCDCDVSDGTKAAENVHCEGVRDSR